MPIPDLPKHLVLSAETAMPILRKRMQFWLAGRLGTDLLTALHATWDVRVVDPAGVHLGVRSGRAPAMVAFWHRHILAMLTHFRGYRVCVPVSESQDGEYVAHAMDRFGFASVRGSTSRGSVRMLRDTLGMVKKGWSPAITPDGPRGPKFSVQPGAALLARRSGLPLYPIGLAARPCWTLSSWDEFVVPRPWARVAISFGPALHAGEFGDSTAFCDTLKEALFAATEAARRALR